MEFLISRDKKAWGYWVLSFKKAEDIEGPIWQVEKFSHLDGLLAFLKKMLEATE